MFNWTFKNMMIGMYLVIHKNKVEYQGYFRSSNDEKIHNVQLTSFEYEDSFIEHGDTKQSWRESWLVTFSIEVKK